MYFGAPLDGARRQSLLWCTWVQRFFQTRIFEAAPRDDFAVEAGKQTHTNCSIRPVHASFDLRHLQFVQVKAHVTGSALPYDSIERSSKRAVHIDQQAHATHDAINVSVQT